MKSVKVLLILVMGFMITNQAVAAFVDHIFHYNVSTQPKQIGQSQGAHVVAYHESGFANFGPYHQFPAANRVRNIIACGEFKLESDPLWVPEGHLGTLDLVDWSTGANPQRGFTKYDFKGRNRAIFCAQSQLPVGYTANVEVRWWHTGVAPVRLLNKFFVVTRANVEFTVSNQEPVTISGEAGNHIIMAMNGQGQPQPFEMWGKKWGINDGHTKFRGFMFADDLPGVRKRAGSIHWDGSTDFSAAALFLYDHKVQTIKPNKLMQSVYNLGGGWPWSIGLL